MVQPVYKIFCKDFLIKSFEYRIFMIRKGYNRLKNPDQISQKCQILLEKVRMYYTEEKLRLFVSEHYEFINYILAGKRKNQQILKKLL